MSVWVIFVAVAMKKYLGKNVDTTISAQGRIIVL